MIQLITRGDDAGNSQSANRAILQCCENGVLRNVSVLANGAQFDDAACTLRHLQNVDFGLHLCLNAEWDAPRWKPVAPRDSVSTLLDNDGMLTRSPNVLHERGFSVDEAMSEIEAQLHKVRDAGFRLSYLDEHMGFSWISGELRARIAELARRENLIDAHSFQSLENAVTTSENGAQNVINALSSTRNTTQSGVYLLVTHPMFDDEEARAFHGAEQSGEQIACDRNNDRKTLCDAGLLEWMRANNIAPIRFSEFSD